MILVGIKGVTMIRNVSMKSSKIALTVLGMMVLSIDGALAGFEFKPASPNTLPPASSSSTSSVPAIPLAPVESQTLLEAAVTKPDILTPLGEAPSRSAPTNILPPVAAAPTPSPISPVPNALPTPSTNPVEPVYIRRQSRMDAPVEPPQASASHPVKISRPIEESMRPASPALSQDTSQEAARVPRAPEVTAAPIAPMPISPRVEAAPKRLVIDPYPMKKTETPSTTVEDKPIYVPEAAKAATPAKTESAAAILERARQTRISRAQPVDSTARPLGVARTDSSPSPVYPAQDFKSSVVKPVSPQPPIVNLPRRIPPVRVEPVQTTPPTGTPVAKKIEQSSSDAAFAEVVGFGKELPLALALSQIVPPEYKYSFDANADAGAIVSWQGGKPWNQILDDMLNETGMTASIQGRQVMIRSGT